MKQTLIATRALSYDGRRIAKGEEFTLPEPHARVWIGLRKARLKTEDDARPVPPAPATPVVARREMTAQPPSGEAVPATQTPRRRPYRRRDVKPDETK